MSGSLPQLFFFYGTLIAGSDNSAASAVHRRLTPIASGSVAGTLWAIPDPAGCYPALVAGPGQVHGNIYQSAAEFEPDDLASLDAWEDFRPGQLTESLYLRETMPVIDATGTRHLAQVYRYNQPLPPGALLIPEGDFRAWLTATGSAAYGG